MRERNEKLLSQERKELSELVWIEKWNRSHCYRQLLLTSPGNFIGLIIASLLPAATSFNLFGPFSFLFSLSFLPFWIVLFPHSITCWKETHIFITSLPMCPFSCPEKKNEEMSYPAQFVFSLFLFSSFTHSIFLSHLLFSLFLSSRLLFSVLCQFNPPAVNHLYRMNERWFRKELFEIIKTKKDPEWSFEPAAGQGAGFFILLSLFLFLPPSFSLLFCPSLSLSFHLWT